MEPRTRANHLAGYVAGTGTRLGPPPAHAAAVVVAVHGRSSSPVHLVEHLVSRVGQDDQTGDPDGDTAEIAWIMPRAEGDTWYPISGLAPISENQPALDDALSVMAAIEAELDGVDPARVMWMGYSQGGCLVAEHLARNPRRWGAVVILTGCMIGPPDDELTVAGSFDGTPAYFSNGDADAWVPLRRTEATAECYRAAGADVTVDVFPGREHEISEAEIGRVRAMLDRVTQQ
jgi:phospholipase/carboxylesterase